jgi:hypothetical protein
MVALLQMAPATLRKISARIKFVNFMSRTGVKLDEIKFEALKTAVLNVISSR